MREGLGAPALHIRPRRVIVLDTETTGFLAYDRIVTLGAVRIEGDELLLNKALYLIFDPRKDSHPDAEAIHGWDNWTTRFQDLFADLADQTIEWLGWADEIVCHNAAFDLHYVERELRKAGAPPLDRPTQCTMEAARLRWPGQSAKLDDCLTRVGLSRSTVRHGALEDALLTAALLLAGRGIAARLPPLHRLPPPKNLKAVPPRPEGDLPRRAPKRSSRGRDDGEG